jgi:hypothetical protein
MHHCICLTAANEDACGTVHTRWRSGKQLQSPQPQLRGTGNNALYSLSANALRSVHWIVSMPQAGI